MKVIFWLSQVALVCSMLYFSPLLSPVISNSWSMEEWSIRYGEYRDCINLKRPEGHRAKSPRRSCNKKAYGLPFFELPDGKHSEIINYNVETFGANLRP